MIQKAVSIVHQNIEAFALMLAGVNTKRKSEICFFLRFNYKIISCVGNRQLIYVRDGMATGATFTAYAARSKNCIRSIFKD